VRRSFQTVSPRTTVNKVDLRQDCTLPAMTPSLVGGTMSTQTRGVRYVSKRKAS
jgi:hypothetical protein